jgi:ribose transport system substrate-binding protein
MVVFERRKLFMTKIAKLVVLIVVMAMVFGLAACGGGAEQPAAEQPAAEQPAAEEPAAEQPAAEEPAAEQPADLEPITPVDFPAQFLPGIEKVGAIPAADYTVALSNGDMANEWRRTFWEDLSAHGKKYNERFGTTIIEANSGADSTKQVQDAQSLLAQSPDILLMSPNESEPLAVVGDMCDEAGIPYMTLDRTVSRTPGEGQYICAIQIDGYEEGVMNGVRIVDDMMKKNGEHKGNIAEISGILGSSPSIHRSAGVRRVLADYPDIKVVISVTGEFDAAKSAQAMKDIMQAKPAGTIDGLVASCDTSAVVAVEEIKAAGRTELLGWIWTVDGLKAGLQGIIDGDIAEISECPPFFGMIAFEYAIQYLNGAGANFPAVVCAPQRDFTGETPEKMAELKAIVAELDARGISFVPSDVGSYAIMVPENPEMVNKYYPMRYWEQPDPEAWLAEFEAYTTE